MAFIDFDDQCLTNGDLWLVKSQKHKISNILQYAFAESPQLWIDVALLMQSGSQPSIPLQIIFDHLRDFACRLDDVQIDYHQRQGKLFIDIKEHHLS
ncbi:hypothetical protein PVA45_07770 (plasmid) [Entomospira entomophila]|uniref:Uncharacterized protein n=1 Tax=Entomospira entomophila TaxID=2719988 RepID=A0A968KUE9_9SPIO|nr:hypothetical protein [Entomospira entomophilus]NIZ41401.1 hypothetical protein [Entomospira entomophilus]WDI36351.1 hypothetical protein PVA45_07770 [Entomospira entomophilus]